MDAQWYENQVKMVKHASSMEKLKAVIRELDREQLTKIKAIVSDPSIQHELSIMVKDRQWFENLLLNAFMK